MIYILFSTIPTGNFQMALVHWLQDGRLSWPSTIQPARLWFGFVDLPNHWPYRSKSVTAAMRRSRCNIAISKMYFSICRLSTDYYVLVGRQRLLSHYRHFKRFQVNWAQKNVQTYSNGCSTSRRCDGLVSLASRTNHTLPPHHHELHDTFSTTCLMSKNPGKKKKKRINQKSVYSTTKIPFHHQLWDSNMFPGHTSWPGSRAQRTASLATSTACDALGIRNRVMWPWYMHIISSNVYNIYVDICIFIYAIVVHVHKMWTKDIVYVMSIQRPESFDAMICINM